MEEVKPEDWLEKVTNLTLRTSGIRFIRSQDTMKMTCDSGVAVYV